MKLEKLSAISELVSSIAIIATLVYLAIETRQNTLATQASVRQAMLAEDRELLFKAMEYPFIARNQVPDLASDEAYQAGAWILAFLRSRESFWLHYQNGTIDEETWLSYRAPILDLLSNDFPRVFWVARTRQGEFSDGFVAEVEALLKQSSFDVRPELPGGSVTR
jgi:hypothetical protein